MNFLANFIRFSRLHTIIGTSLSIAILYVIACSYLGDYTTFLPLLGWTLLSCLGANIYIVGLNQIIDVDIDRINKPYLPLASGAFSMRLGYALVTISVIVSLVIAFYIGQYLLLTVLLSLILGTAYSLPPIRLKRFAFWAAVCIIAVRGLIVNILLFLHFHASINESHTVTPVVWVLTVTIFIYSIIIAWFKDIPDIEGDSKYNIQTLSIKLGPKRVFQAGNILLAITFLSLISFAYYKAELLNLSIMVIAHSIFLVILIVMARNIKLNKKASIARYYQFVWVLFFGEYIVIGLATIV